jgi:hypothetical protein
MPKLESLRVQEYRVHYSTETKVVTELFPVGEYTCQIRKLHLQLPRLETVTIHVLGDQIECMECQEEENDTCPHSHDPHTVPNLGVEYKFSGIGIHRESLNDAEIYIFDPEWYVTYQTGYPIFIPPFTVLLQLCCVVPGMGLHFSDRSWYSVCGWFYTGTTFSFV